MGRIHVLAEDVANKIAAGEVVERPASVVKELLENSLDAGARRLRILVEAGGKKLIKVVDDGCGMSHDDAMLAFERHATSKIKNANDLLNIATLGFRGEALPSIASVSRLLLESKAGDQGGAGTLIEINGGRLLRVEEAGLPAGTAVTVKDLFFNTPARRKFLKAESTELSHIAQLVTQYALAHPEMHFELHSATSAMLEAPPVANYAERVYQIFGKETLDQLLPLAAATPLERVGLPAPPPWAIEKMKQRGEDYRRPDPGELRLTGFVSRPEIQKLNRNSIFIFVNARLVRDRLLQHALTEAYRNILPATVFPVVLVFLELPAEEVDANVHPSKVEVRFRQSSFVHDFVRDSVRAALLKARPVPQFTREITAQPTAAPALSPTAAHPSASGLAAAAAPGELSADAPPLVGAPLAGQGGESFELQPPTFSILSERLRFGGGFAVEGNAAVPVAKLDWSQPARAAGGPHLPGAPSTPEDGVELASVISGAELCAAALADEPEPPEPKDTPALATLRPLGQVRESFILAVNRDGLWIIDQHVAHERVLFERVLRRRAASAVEGQRLLMPLIIELTPGQQAIFTEIASELRQNGFEAEPFGSRTVAVKTAPAGVEASDIERMLLELLDQVEREEQAINLEKIRARIAASVACHAAIKINTPLTEDKMKWLLSALAETECPMTCPHGRPVVLRYSLADIQKAFKRI